VKHCYFHFHAKRHYAQCHFSELPVCNIMLSDVMVNVLKLNLILSVIYAECRCAECHCADGHGAISTKRQREHLSLCFSFSFDNFSAQKTFLINRARRRNIERREKLSKKI
jgi:hypothetical protein